MPRNQQLTVATLSALVGIILGVGSVVFAVGKTYPTRAEVEAAIQKVDNSKVNVREFDALREDIKEVRNDIKTLLNRAGTGRP
jgi:ABC-type antimicrobial peptide transport system permease subunit